MKTIIAFLDKEYPPSHSFVDGMLATQLAKEKDINVRLLVSKNENVTKKVYKYKKSSCLPVLLSRKGFNRILNFFISTWYLHLLLNREYKRSSEVVLFVRNDPIYLFACALMKQKNQKLIFQSSFPHEEVSGGIVKRLIAKKLYQISAFGIDGLLTVSPAGLRRVQKIFPKVNKGNFIPLLAQDGNDNLDKFDVGEKVHFIYIGSHAKERKLEYIFQAIDKAMQNNINADFEFIGAKKEEIESFLQQEYIQKLCNYGILNFVEFIPRNEIWNKLQNADIGLCYIPPDPHYLEASPTKLTEYMKVGLAVLASNGIELQEKFINDSKGGKLADWDVDSMADAIIQITTSKNEIIKMKQNAYKYAKESLNYGRYVCVIRNLFE